MKEKTTQLIVSPIPPLNGIPAFSIYEVPSHVVAESLRCTQTTNEDSFAVPSLTTLAKTLGREFYTTSALGTILHSAKTGFAIDFSLSNFPNEQPE